jgi:predicted Zn-ribbon and HTH transcriptional regulator
LLENLSTKFASVSKEIYDKIEAMSKRLDAMEASLQVQTAQGKGEGKGEGK